MAIIKFGSVITGMRGSIGGTTFSANGSGDYAKAWRAGPNPRSELQSAQRATLGGLGASWLSLTSAQRTAWDTYAALPAQKLTNSLGVDYYASGWNWFVKNQLQQLQRTSTPTVTAPVGARPTAPTISALVVDETGGASDSWITVPNNEFVSHNVIGFMKIWNSTAVQSGAFNFTWLEAEAAFGGTIHFIGTNINTVFGLTQVGQRVCSMWHKQGSDGQRSAGTTIYTDVIA